MTPLLGLLNKKNKNKNKKTKKMNDHSSWALKKIY